MKRKLEYETCLLFVSLINDYLHFSLENKLNYSNQLIALTLFDLKCKIEKKMIGFKKELYSINFTNTELLALILIPEIFLPPLNVQGSTFLLNFIDDIHKKLQSNR